VILQSNDLLLFASDEERFLRELPPIEGDALEVIRARVGDPAVTAVAVKPTHVSFIAELWDLLSPRYPHWDVVDVGGFVGNIGLPIAAWVQREGLADRVRIQILEPSRMHDLIERSAKLNGLDVVVSLLNAAASDRSGTATYAAEAGNFVSGRLQNATGDYATEVRTVAIDEIISDEADLCFIKIDTEGHEPAVLQGLRRTLSTRPVLAVIEFHPFLIGAKMGNATYEEFLFEQFLLFDVGNFGYLDRWTPIEHGNVEHLRACAHRDLHTVTDLFGISRRLDEDSIRQVMERLDARRRSSAGS
jgi:FkbM family methyltransferase